MMPSLLETLWYVSGPSTTMRLAELVLFAIAVWFCRRRNGAAAVEMVCIAWTVAALDSARYAFLALQIFRGPRPIAGVYDALTAFVIGFPLPCLMTLVLILSLPRGLTFAPLTWSTKALIAVPLIAILDVLLIGIILLPLLPWL